MTLSESKIANITYTKDNGESSDRVIIPTYVPNSALVRAIDVTELSAADQVQMERLVAEYREYKDHILKTMFTFEDWVDHTYHQSVSPKWRSFKPGNIETV